MLVRILLGVLKGLMVGGLVGFGVAKLGFSAPGGWVAYPAAALVGVLIGLVAGKPIWAKDARIEAGMKAGVGLVVGVGLMFAIRKWLGFALPLDLGALTAANDSLNQTTPSFGGSAITSLTAVAVLLGAFYDADNTPEPEEQPGQKAGAKASGNKRIGAELEADDDLELETDARENDTKRAKR